MRRDSRLARISFPEADQTAVGDNLADRWFSMVVFRVGMHGSGDRDGL